MKPNPWIVFLGACVIVTMYFFNVKTIPILFYSGWLAALFLIIFGIFNKNGA